jgi:uncharacterized OsmC-like protein
VPVINGIDTTQLTEAIAAVEKDYTLGEVTFSASSEWLGAFRASSQTGPIAQAGIIDRNRETTFTLESDEPPVLLGGDTAPSAGEYVLKALAACYAVTFAANAAAQGITLTELKFDLAADFDLRGFFGLDETVRPGVQALRVRVRASSEDVSTDQLEELVRTVERRSPIRDTLANPVRVTTELVA